VCDFAFTNILTFNGDFRSRRETNLGYRGVDRPGPLDILPKIILHESCRMGRRIDEDALNSLLVHCESHRHTVHKLSQRRLTAD